MLPSFRALGQHAAFGPAIKDGIARIVNGLEDDDLAKPPRAESSNGAWGDYEFDAEAQRR
jgi:hypothetical protein